MARIRTIKPEFPQSESMGRVSREARLLFVLLWTLADDEGRLRGNSRMLASLLFPYDDDAPSLIDGWLGELQAQSCVVRYEEAGGTYLEICNWLIHQKIDKPSKSKIPAIGDSSRILANPREGSSEDQGSRIKDLRTKDQGPKDLPPPPSGASPPSLAPAEPDPPPADPSPADPPPADPAPPKPPDKADAPAVLVRVQDLVADGVDEQHAKDWIVLRKARRLPLTASAWALTKDHGAQAGLTPAATVEACIGLNWAGFRADWWLSRKAQGRVANAPAPETPYERRARERVEAMAPRIAACAPGGRPEFLDIEGASHAVAVESR
jgi:hypothetical protein